MITACLYTFGAKRDENILQSCLHMHVALHCTFHKVVCSNKVSYSSTWRIGDSERWVCGMRISQDMKHCLVYSLGSQADTSFMEKYSCPHYCAMDE